MQIMSSSIWKRQRRMRHLQDSNPDASGWRSDTVTTPSPRTLICILLLELTAMINVGKMHRSQMPVWGFFEDYQLELNKITIFTCLVRIQFKTFKFDQEREMKFSRIRSILMYNYEGKFRRIETINHSFDQLNQHVHNSFIAPFLRNR